MIFFRLKFFKELILSFKTYLFSVKIFQGINIIIQDISL